MRNIFLLLLLIVFVVSSCHFYDDRVSVENTGNRECLFAITKQNPIERSDILSPFFPLKPQQERVISLLKNSSYNHMEGDSIYVMQIFPEDEKEVLRQNGYYEYEQILEDKNYTYLAIAIRTIVEKEVHVIYTESTFRPAR